MKWCSIYSENLVTLSKRALLCRLARLENGLDEDAHAALGGVLAADYAKAERLVACAFLEDDGEQTHGQ